MSDTSERIALEGELTDLTYAEELSTELRGKHCALDWTAVTRVTDAFADVLVAGLEPEVVGDANGSST